MESIIAELIVRSDRRVALSMSPAWRFRLNFITKMNKQREVSQRLAHLEQIQQMLLIDWNGLNKTRNQSDRLRNTGRPIHWLEYTTVHVQWGSYTTRTLPLPTTECTRRPLWLHTLLSHTVRCPWLLVVGFELGRNSVGDPNRVPFSGQLFDVFFRIRWRRLGNFQRNSASSWRKVNMSVTEGKKHRIWIPGWSNSAVNNSPA